MCQDGIDPIEDKDDIVVLQQRHAVMSELLGVKIWTPPCLKPDDPDKFFDFLINNIAYTVLDKYPVGEVSTSQANFTQTISAIDDASIPFCSVPVDAQLGRDACQHGRHEDSCERR